MFNSRTFTFAALVLLAAALFQPPAQAAPDPSSKPKKNHGSKLPFAVGVKASTLGLGLQAGIGIGSHLNIRGGFNAMDYNRRITDNGIPYDATLRFRSAEALVDIFPPFFKSFHISPGLLFYNGNQITGTALVPGGSAFSLNGVPLVSNPANPVNGTGAILLNKAAPMIRLGFGNLVPRKSHFGFLIEAGVIFQGTPKAQLALNGSACDPLLIACLNVATDPTMQSLVQAEQAKINSRLNIVKFYPDLSIGFSYRF